MSALGDLRGRLETIHDMLPLSDREKVLAQMVLEGDGDIDIAADIRQEPQWWGEKAAAVSKVLSDD